MSGACGRVVVVVVVQFQHFKTSRMRKTPSDAPEIKAPATSRPLVCARGVGCDAILQGSCLASLSGFPPQRNYTRSLRTASPIGLHAIADNRPSPACLHNFLNLLCIANEGPASLFFLSPSLSLCPTPRHRSPGQPGLNVHPQDETSRTSLIHPHFSNSHA